MMALLQYGMVYVCAFFRTSTVDMELVIWIFLVPF